MIFAIILSLFQVVLAQELPERIYFDTDIHATTVKHYYAIKDHHLWYKANPDSNPDGTPVQWEIFKGGLPFDKKTLKPMVSPTSLKAVYADGDVISVIDHNRQVYVHQTRSRLSAEKTHYNWGSVWGSPIADKIFIPQNIRSMTLTRRSANTIEYMEDRIGNQIKGGGEGPVNEKGEGSFGGLIHIFLLNEDGTEINYADTGLPPGFGYRYATPYRGRFIAESIAGSGSIVFLIGKSGHIFSRPLDFDMNGNNPMMYDYTYYPTPNKDKYDGDNEDRFAFVNLPAIPWYEEPQIPIWGNRTITRKITMVSTGSGNMARELRVQGQDENGAYGYYYKGIFTQDEWQFRITEQKFDQNEVMISSTQHTTLELGPNKDLSFDGRLTVKKFWGEKDFSAKVLNFNMVDSPCEIEIELKSGETFPILLHTVDMWTMQTIDDPGRDGTPKASLGTLEIPESVLGTTNNNIRRFVERYLLKAHLAEFRFIVRGSQEYLFIDTRDKNLPFKLRLGTNIHQIENIDEMNQYLSIVKQSKSLSEDQDLLENYRTLREKVHKQKTLQNVANFGAQLVDKLPVVGWLDEWSVFPAPKKLFRWGPVILKSRAEIISKQLEDLDEVISVLEKRISER